MGEAQTVVLADKERVAREAAERLVRALQDALTRRSEAHLALTGGSSAKALYGELVQHWRDALDWERIHLWWGDDRFVPVDHPDSNTGLAYSMLLAMGARAAESAGLPVPAENVHPFEIDEALSESDAGELVAQRYIEALESRLPKSAAGLPAFDVILLGVGTDGHLMSVFPESEALAPGSPLVLAIPAPTHIDPHLPRVTLNPRLFEAAGLLLVMVGGEEKAEVIAQVLQGQRDTRRFPAQLAVRDNAVWLLDEGSAAQLSRAPDRPQPDATRK